VTADALLQFLTQALFVVVFAAVLVRAARRSLRAHVDTALLFGALALIVARQWANQYFGVAETQLLDVIVATLLMALPYLHVRLVEDFARVPRWLVRGAEAGLAASFACIAGYAIAGMSLPLPLVVALIAYFVVVEVYAATRFVREARTAGGVTRRRMQAVAAGSGLLGAVIFLILPAQVFPALAPLLDVVNHLCGLACGLAYFVGFAPPSWLRRAWQEPELRVFLSRAASLPRLPTTRAIVDALETGAAASLGAPRASVALWDDERGALRFLFRSPAPLAALAGPAGGAGPPGTAEAQIGAAVDLSGPELLLRPGQTTTGRAYAEQRGLFTANARRDDPANALYYRAYGIRAEIAAPITAGEQRLGVLVVSAPRAPIFAEEDLSLVQLLADQAAVVLESRALIDEAARVRAREEATRLKDDFLSAAAHDLKTPLTTLVAQAQLLERRARRNPSAPADLHGIDRLVKEAKRLSTLVVELLDASRAERGLLVGQTQPVDLAALARESCARQADGRCRVEAPEPVVAPADPARAAQLMDNLVENALKYSPRSEPVVVRVWLDHDDARIAIADHGIGIPAADQPHVFDRFYRAGNVDDRRFAGMGLGLYICKGIAEQHGGRIWVESTPGRGSTFHVALPAAARVMAS
jgi:signal transduction histidine kinase